MAEVDIQNLPRSASPEDLYRWIVEFVQQPSREEFRVSRGASTPALPPGAPIFWPNPLTVPAGYFPWDGRLLGRRSYPGLFKAYGTRFNIGGEDATKFRLPNADEKFPYQVDDVYGGSPQIVLTSANLPETEVTITDPGHGHEFTPTPHNHTITDPGHTHSYDVAVAVGGAVFQGGTGGRIETNTLTTGSNITGISVNNASADGTVDSALTGITATLPGSSAPIPFEPPFIGGVWIVFAC